TKRYGVPFLADGPRAGQASRYVLLALGKLGGREMGYHSDLDLILIYEGDGQTVPPAGSTPFGRDALATNLHCFTELAGHIIKAASYLGPMGRLYQVDMRLRPTGKSGSLVIPLSEFRRYYEEGTAQLWERQALTRARAVFGDAAFGREVMAAVEHAAYGQPWQPEAADESWDMPERVEASGSERDLKRGFGGIIDVELLVQLFRLKYGNQVPALRNPNTWQTLDALKLSGHLKEDEYARLRAGYDFLRLVESRLRIVHNRSLDELPQRPEDLEKLARRLGCEADAGISAGQHFLAELDRHTSEIFESLLHVLQREKRAPV